MTPELLAYLQRSLVALQSGMTAEDQIKVLRTVSQMTAMAAADIEVKHELENN